MTAGEQRLADALANGTIFEKYDVKCKTCSYRYPDFGKCPCRDSSISPLGSLNTRVIEKEPPKPTLKHYEDISYAVEMIVERPRWADFKVFELCQFQNPHENEIYTSADNPSCGVSSTAEAEIMFQGHIKADGCLEIHTGDCAVNHFCDRKSAMKIGTLMSKIYDLASTVMPEWDAREEMTKEEAEIAWQTTDWKRLHGRKLLKLCHDQHDVCFTSLRSFKNMSGLEEASLNELLENLTAAGLIIRNNLDSVALTPLGIVYVLNFIRPDGEVSIKT